MNHPLVMHVDQSSCSISKLQQLCGRQWQAKIAGSEGNAYEFQPICICTRLHKLVDVTMCHPFRYHHKLILSYCHTQEWHHIWMAESPPSNNLPTEPLRGVVRFERTTSQEHHRRPTLLICSRSSKSFADSRKALAAVSLSWC